MQGSSSRQLFSSRGLKGTAEAHSHDRKLPLVWRSSSASASITSSSAQPCGCITVTRSLMRLKTLRLGRPDWAIRVRLSVASINTVGVKQQVATGRGCWPRALLISRQRFLLSCSCGLKAQRRLSASSPSRAVRLPRSPQKTRDTNLWKP